MKKQNSKIYENLNDIKQIDQNIQEFLGTFYLLEYGEYLKIGCSKKPYQRLKQLERQAKYADYSIGKFAVSIPHTNYRSNEKCLHKLFSSYRNEDTELFKVKIEDALGIVNQSDILYEDKSAELQKRTSAFVDAVKSFILGGTTWNS